MLHGQGQNGFVSINPAVTVTRDKQLAAVNVSVALFKWHHEMACNLKEVAVVTGYYYAHVRRWGLPLFDGKITRAEFTAWKRKRMAEKRTDQAERQPPLPLDRRVGPATAARQRRLAASNLKSAPQPASLAYLSRQNCANPVQTAGSEIAESKLQPASSGLLVHEAVCPT
jgi:hypothetical protein